MGDLDPERFSFTELIDRLNGGDEAGGAQLVKEFEPAVRRELRFRLRDSRARLELDSMDISQSVLSNFFVRVAARQYDLKEPGDFVRLLVTMTRNKVAERLWRRTSPTAGQSSNGTWCGEYGVGERGANTQPSAGGQGTTSAGAPKS